LSFLKIYFLKFIFCFLFRFPIFYESRSTHFILKIFSYLIKQKFYRMAKNRDSIIAWSQLE